MFLTAWTIAERAVESSPSKAYEPFLIERGVKPVWARGLASLTIGRGRRRANESRRLPAAVGAIRFLAKHIRVGISKGHLAQRKTRIAADLNLLVRPTPAVPASGTDHVMRAVARGLPVAFAFPKATRTSPPIKA
jgi:hypothetical protein